MIRLVILVLFLATGCATGARTDTIAFDRGAFALVYADVSHLMKAACAAKKPVVDAAECARLDEIDRSVRKQIMTPPASPAPSGVDMDQLMRMLGTLGKLAM